MTKNEKKLIVKFQGGLGNQLYEYAFCEWLRQQYSDYEVLADLSYYKIRSAHGELGIWNIFPNINIEVASNWDIIKYSDQIPIMYGGKGADRLNSVRTNVNDRFFSKRKHSYYTEISNTDVSEVINALNNGIRYFDGYWQNIDYFKGNIEDLRNKLKFSEKCDKYITDEMLRDNAVSLHVRRGDYVGSEYEKEVGLSYYKKAVEYVLDRVDQAKFFIFSDDKYYAETAFEWIDNKTVVAGYDNELAHVDMLLMSRMKNNIIANSTFSLWAAYLNDSMNPLIVYPDVESLDKKTFSDWNGIK
ncbi:glycosyl transferase GT11 family [Butyrivibrio proteoclasticus B316]|uniref:Glycosyl transferase GT11 family n=1 Tax=Butyrivibrio proteoclasticus (strain ATCC 51982 / DSM 14932 / B316) TaxID=515622 RepID=E0RZD3_BUTPB|nr:alpha-1,2-fucosyltransferase [Butyrivibrio proteoclasticus]ADL33130.1 glycosyl transferase GT11 family [Butyrivibrio proteoclasticus B316]